MMALGIWLLRSVNAMGTQTVADATAQQTTAAAYTQPQAAASASADTHIVAFCLVLSVSGAAAGILLFLRKRGLYHNNTRSRFHLH